MTALQLQVTDLRGLHTVIRAILLPCSLSRTVVFCFSLGSWSTQSGSGPLEQCREWVLSHGMSLKPNQRVAGFSHSIGAAIAPACHAGGSPLSVTGFAAKAGVYIYPLVV